MNRIQLCDTLPGTNFEKTTGIGTQHPLLETATRDVEHSVFVPLHYEPNYSYPLLVWLHGPGDDQQQLKKIMPLISMRNFMGVSPCGTALEAGKKDSPTYSGYTWRQEAHDIAVCEERVTQCIERVSSRFNVRQSRIFIGGYDSGGTMALRMAMMRPELFSGVVSVGGCFPRGLNPLTRIGAIRNLPVMMLHGRDSTEYGAMEACKDLRLTHTAGMSVAIRQYPCEQEVTTVMLEDVNRWLMDIVSGTVVQSAANDWQSQNDPFDN